MVDNIAHVGKGINVYLLEFFGRYTPLLQSSSSLCLTFLEATRRSPLGWVRLPPALKRVSRKDSIYRRTDTEIQRLRS